MASIAALDSLRQAEFFASEVTGARVPDGLFDRLRSAGDEAEEGLRVTVELFRALATRVAGVQVTPLHGSGRAAERLLEAIADRSRGAATEPQAARRG
jgi:5,10-methylenetetrahydrofolate reductase